MKIGDLVAGWRAEDGLSLKVSSIKPQLMKLSAMVTFALMVSAGAVHAQDKVPDGQHVFKSPTLETLTTAIGKNKLKYSAEVFNSGENNTTAHLDANDVATGCRITLHHSHPNLEDVKMTQADKDEYTYLHEQAHCADYAHLFKGVDAYKKDEKYTQTLSADVLMKQSEAILNEGFADAFALLKLSAKNPNKANLYFNEIHRFRFTEEQASIKGHYLNDHDTRVAISQAAKAWNQLNLEKVKSLSRTPAGNAQLEQEFAVLASKAARDGLRAWMNNSHYDVSALSDNATPIEQMVKQSALSNNVDQNKIQDWRDKRAAPALNTVSKGL